MKLIRDGSWFSGSHLSLEKILEITYLWCEDLPQHTIMKWCQVAEHTIVDWCCFCREVCIVYEADHFERIGGPEHILEMSLNLANGSTIDDGCERVSGCSEELKEVQTTSS